MQAKDGGGHSPAAYFNPVQVDLQWIRRVQKEEKSLLEVIDGSPNKGANKIDDVYQHFGSAYFYQSEFLKNHMYLNGGPPGGIGAPFNTNSRTKSRRQLPFP